ncbi:hypothetical protein FKW77_005999 [Venturia effusa]|uniref:Uncharacterized protein n=1 Tax=Venturia effusa TaxID=50376 RepID=A0A517L5G9_9PEZI|nr:hypothetical protein FKW77_005999 [Venturia effusa]
MSYSDSKGSETGESPVPELIKPEVDSVLAAACNIFEVKLDRYLSTEYGENTRKLLREGPLIKLHAFYECAMGTKKIPFIDFETNRPNYLRALVNSKNLEAIGDLVLKEFMEDNARYHRDAKQWAVKHLAILDDESDRRDVPRSVRIADIEDDDEDEEGSGGYQGDVPLLYRTSPSPEPAHEREPIEEEDEDGDEDDDSSVFL